MKTRKQSKRLIVHQRPQVMRELEAALKKPHRIFLTATSALETLSMTSIDDVDLIILDTQLEDAEVISLTGILKLQDKTKNIPYIILNETTSIIEHYFKSWPEGSVDFLVYPIDGNKIENSLSKFEQSNFNWKVKVK